MGSLMRLQIFFYKLLPYDSKDPLVTTITIMKYTGIWVPDNIANKYYKTISVTLVTFLYSLMVFAEIGYIFTVGDPEKIVDAAVLLISHIVQGVKIFNIVCRQERIKRLIKFIKGPKFTKTDPAKKAIIEQQLETGAMVGNAVNLATLATAILWCVFPVLKSEVTLPLKTAYPFDVNKSPVFEIMYVYSAVSVTFFGLNDVGINYLYAGLMIMAGAHLDVLKEELVEVDYKGKKDNYEGAVECIKYHQNIIEYVNELRNIFGLIVFCQTIATSAVICMSLSKITVTTEPAELMSMIFYISCVFVELLIYCYTGDLLINKSLEVADAAAPSTWTGSLRSRRVLLLCMLRAQRALSINAGGVITASLPTAAAVVQASYSYYAVLQQKINENK